MKNFIWFILLISVKLRASDTLVRHPVYPPLVFKGDEYNFYKYTPKYIPDNLLHCFKILATSGEENLNRFRNRSKNEVIERGIFERGYRIRKEFCLEGFSPFTQFFHRRGIYYPHAIQTYILLSFHQYLRGEKIKWIENKSASLAEMRTENSVWKRRSQILYQSFKGGIILELPDTVMTEEDYFFQW